MGGPFEARVHAAEHGDAGAGEVVGERGGDLSGVVGGLEAADDRDGGRGEQLAQALDRAAGVQHRGRAGELREREGVVGVVAAERGRDALGGERRLQVAPEPAGVLDLGGAEQPRVGEGEQGKQAFAGERQARDRGRKGCYQRGASPARGARHRAQRSPAIVMWLRSLMLMRECSFLGSGGRHG